jgi:hypothetical protein
MLSSSLPYSSQPIQDTSPSAQQEDILLSELPAVRKHSRGKPGILISLLVLLIILGTLMYVRLQLGSYIYALSWSAY